MPGAAMAVFTTTAPVMADVPVVPPHLSHFIQVPYTGAIPHSTKLPHLLRPQRQLCAPRIALCGRKPHSSRRGRAAVRTHIPLQETHFPLQYAVTSLSGV